MSYDNAPLAVTIPRPWSLLISLGLWSTLVSRRDPRRLLGQQVVIHTGPRGQHWLHRNLDAFLGDKLPRPDPDRACPHQSLAAVATVERVTEGHGHTWVWHLAEVTPLRVDLQPKVSPPKGVELLEPDDPPLHGAEQGTAQVLGVWALQPVHLELVRRLLAQPLGRCG